MSTTPGKSTGPSHTGASRLLDVAIDIASNAPLKHGPTTSHCLVYWPDIEALRAALDAMGIEWRDGR